MYWHQNFLPLVLVQALKIQALYLCCKNFCQQTLPNLHFSCTSPQLTRKTINTDTAGRHQAAFVFHSLSLLSSSSFALLRQMWSASWGLQSLAKGMTNFPSPKCIPQSPKSQVQEANTLLAECVIDVWLRVVWSQHILYASEKIISFTLGGALGCFFNHQSWQEPTGSLRDTDGFIHRYKAKTLGMLMSWSCKLWLNPSVVLLHTAWSIMYAVRWSYSIVHPRRKSNPICHCLEINQNWSSLKKKNNSASLHQQIHFSSGLKTEV